MIGTVRAHPPHKIERPDPLGRRARESGNKRVFRHILQQSHSGRTQLGKLGWIGWGVKLNQEQPGCQSLGLTLGLLEIGFWGSKDCLRPEPDRLSLTACGELKAQKKRRKKIAAPNQTTAGLHTILVFSKSRLSNFFLDVLGYSRRVQTETQPRSRPNNRNRA